ncbi:hypothetical protein ACH3XW_16830 [Acanthocheilonema viteae]
MLLQWLLLLWYTVGIAVSATEFNHWRKSGIFTNYDSNGWKPYPIIDDELSRRQFTTYNRNSAPQLLENGELLWNIRNILQKLSSQININDLHPIWNSIQNGALGEKLETFLQQQQQERQSQRNGYYDTFWKEPRRFAPLQ